MKQVHLLLSIFLLSLLLVSCTVTAEFGPYYGKVIDTETKAPIEGAAVLAVYKTEQYGLAGAVPQFADAQETLTDANGEFRIPPIRVYKIRLLSGWERHPSFTIFKPAYGCYPNHRDAKPLFVPNWSLPSNEYVTVELPLLRTKEERLKNVGCRPVGVPDEAMKQLTKTINIENSHLGLQPYQEVKE